MFLLMAEFETSTIPLSVIAERYLGMRPATADKKGGLRRVTDTHFPCW
jgi:hypothetical protein